MPHHTGSAEKVKKIAAGVLGGHRGMARFRYQKGKRLVQFTVNPAAF